MTETRFLKVCLLVLALCVLGTLIFIGTRRHFTDRLLGVNLITTLVLNVIVVLSLVMEAPAILDIDIVYALLGFQAVVVLSRILRVRMLSDKKRKGGARP
ncbi:MAG: MrpF/PhaF family protein [Oscillospiraceae bacterium]|nr:MrpF/PhaF family protein [Oscillospiraceae bacterium]